MCWLTRKQRAGRPVWDRRRTGVGIHIKLALHSCNANGHDAVLSLLSTEVILHRRRRQNNTIWPVGVCGSLHAHTLTAYSRRAGNHRPFDDYGA